MINYFKKLVENTGYSFGSKNTYPKDKNYCFIKEASLNLDNMEITIIDSEKQSETFNDYKENLTDHEFDLLREIISTIISAY